MTRNILLILTGFMIGMTADAVLFQLPRLHECYDTKSEIMDVVDYYALMLTRSLNTCEDIINDNIVLTRRHREIVTRNAELVEQCGIRGINIRNDE
jgi:NADH:ubiquinone oxidoreductase subunit D